MTAAPAKLTNFQIESLLTQLPGWTIVAGKDLNKLPPEISEVTTLRSLTLGGLTDSTRISDLEALSSLFNLERLHLGRTRVVNITPLARLKKLSNLNLSETRISDIVALSKLPNLSRLNLYRTRVTDLSPLKSRVWTHNLIQ